MIDTGIIITGAVGIVTTVISSLVTWAFSRKKYYSEVDHNNIENMENSLEFYERLSASNNKILAEVLEKSEKLAQTNVELLIEVQNLRAQIGILTEVLRNEVDTADFERYGIKIQEDGTLVRA
jgi:hypothetical protein